MKRSTSKSKRYKLSKEDNEWMNAPMGRPNVLKKKVDRLMDVCMYTLFILMIINLVILVVYRT